VNLGSHLYLFGLPIGPRDERASPRICSSKLTIDRNFIVPRVQARDQILVILSIRPLDNTQNIRVQDDHNRFV